MTRFDKAAIGRLLASSLVVFVLVWPLAVYAQRDVDAGAGAAESVRQVTLQEVVDHALAASRLAKLAEAQMRIGASEAAEISSALGTRLTIGGQTGRLGQTTHIDPTCFTFTPPVGTDPQEFTICLPERSTSVEMEGWSHEASVSMRGTLWTGSLVRTTRDLATLSEAAAAIEYDQSMIDLTLQVVDLYYGVLQAEASVSLLELALREAELQLQEKEWQVGAAAATEVDRLKAAARVMELEGELIRAQGGLERARIALNQVAGYPLDVTFKLEQPDSSVWSVPTLWEALRAAQDRPDIRQARLRLQQAEAHQKLIRLQNQPSLQLFGSYQEAEYNLVVGIDRHGIGQATLTYSDTDLSSKDKEMGELIDSISMPRTEGWAVGLRVEWSPLDGGTRAAQEQKAAAQVEAARLHLELLLAGVESEVRQAEASLRAAAGAVSAARKALEAMIEAERRMEEVFARGAASESSLLQVRLGKAQAEQALLQAEHAYVKAVIEYRRAAGLL